MNFKILRISAKIALLRQFLIIQFLQFLLTSFHHKDVLLRVVVASEPNPKLRKGNDRFCTITEQYSTRWHKLWSSKYILIFIQKKPKYINYVIEYLSKKIKPGLNVKWNGNRKKESSKEREIKKSSRFLLFSFIEYLLVSDCVALYSRYLQYTMYEMMNQNGILVFLQLVHSTIWHHMTSIASLINLLCNTHSAVLKG